MKKLLFFLAVILSSCCDEQNEPLPDIVLTGDEIKQLECYEVKSYMIRQNLNTMTITKITNTNYYLVVFEDGKMCYVDFQTYNCLL